MSPPDPATGPPPQADPPASPSRRRVLQVGAAAVVGAGAALGGRAAWDARRPAAPVSPSAEPSRVPFRGERQAGVATQPQAFCTLLAFDLHADVDRDALVRWMRVWTDDAEALAAGRAPLADQEPELAALPARLTSTVGYGPGLFAAAGLEQRRPSWLAPLPAFAVDRLQPRWCGGDVVLQVCADDEVALAHAVRVLSADASSFATVRWTQRGFRHSPGTTRPGATMRNLMGQLDGSHNVDPATDPALVWSTGGAWPAGGTSLVVRRIAMDLDAWDGVDRGSREAAIGRRLSDGAPLTGQVETDLPDLTARTAAGFTVIGPAAHVRRATATVPTERFLRRPYNYLDETGAGLLFCTYQADPVAQLVPVQARLAAGDVLNVWTTPVGSAVFAVPPGARAGQFLGQSVLVG